MDAMELYDIAERYIELVNPSSVDKIMQIGEALHLGPDTRVIDYGCGFGEPLALWAEGYGISGVGIDLRERACERAASAEEQGPCCSTGGALSPSIISEEGPTCRREAVAASAQVPVFGDEVAADKGGEGSVMPQSHGDGGDSSDTLGDEEDEDEAALGSPEEYEENLGDASRPDSCSCVRLGPSTRVASTTST